VSADNLSPWLLVAKLIVLGLYTCGFLTASELSTERFVNAQTSNPVSRSYYVSSKNYTWLAERIRQMILDSRGMREAFD
jgi:hypothetical protein